MYTILRRLASPLEEHDLYGKAYAQQVIKNAQALAPTLDGTDIEIFAREKGYTQSHQIWAIIGDQDRASQWFRKLERINIHVNPIKIPFTDRYGFRIGTSELTRRGFKENDIRQVGELILQCIQKCATAAALQKEVEALALGKQKLAYAFDDPSWPNRNAPSRWSDTGAHQGLSWT